MSVMQFRAKREGFGEGLVEAARRDGRVVALSGDLGDSTKAKDLQTEFPDRYFELGIAEQNLVGTAAGLALTGNVPFATSYGTFLMRAWEQIRVSVAYNDVNVKLVASHCGLNVGADGATAQMLEDIALMRVLPNMMVVVPADAEEARKATLAVAAMDGPVYLRTDREKFPVWTTREDEFYLGRANTVQEGVDVTIVACGAMVWEALQAAEALSWQGIFARVVNMHTIKPIDVEVIVAAARETGAIVTAEEHQLVGGLGSAVAEVLAQHAPVPQEFVAVRDQFGESGTARELLLKHGLTSDGIMDAAQRVLERKADLATERA